jgi:hypothetical protein
MHTATPLEDTVINEIKYTNSREAARYKAYVSGRSLAEIVG